MPFTTPVEAPTDAVAGTLLLHAPPVVASASVLLPPIHNMREPVIGATAGSTLSVVVAVQPVVPTNVITAVPVAIADTEPVVAPMVATEVLLLDQVPPPVTASANVVLAPTHSVVLPVIGNNGFTLMVLVAVDTPPQASVEVTV